MPDVPGGDGRLADSASPAAARAAPARPGRGRPRGVGFRRERRARTPPEKKDTPWKLIVFGALAVYAILIVLFNRKQVEVSFVFFSAQDLDCSS